MARPRVFVIAVGFLLQTISCRQGLDRTNFDEWDLRAFDALGIQMEVPADAFKVLEMPGEIALLMHPVFPPAPGFSEAQPLLEIRVRRMERRDFLERQAWVEQMDRPRAEMEMLAWDRAWHDSIERWGQSQLVYRRDVDCPDGSIVTARATIQHAEIPVVREGRNADEEAIGRILSSIRCSISVS